MVYRTSWQYSILNCQGKVHGNTEIAKGDLLFLDRIDGLRERGSSVADNYVYPFNKISGSTLTLDSNKTLAYENFIGVAAWHSDSGVTESISVHFQGLFKYPLRNSRYTKIGYDVVPAGSGVTLYNQKVAIEDSSSNSIGKVANSGKFQNSTEMMIVSQVFRHGVS